MKNYKTLPREIKDLMDEERAMFMDGKTQYC